MAKDHLAIYVPGLGDDKMFGDSLLTNFWQANGIKVIIHKFYWRDERPFAAKLQELINEIDHYTQAGLTVSLVGTSAGASAVLNAYVERKSSVHKVVFICGKLGGFEVVNPRYYQKNPALKESFELVPDSIFKLTDFDKKKMLSLQPVKDWLVPVKDTQINGVENKRIWSFGHIPSIIIALLFYFRFIAKFIKAQ